MVNVVPSLLVGSIPNWLAAPAPSPEVEELIKGWVEEEKSRLANARQEIQTVRMTLPAAFQESSAIVMEGNCLENRRGGAKCTEQFDCCGVQGWTLWAVSSLEAPVSRY